MGIIYEGVYCEIFFLMKKSAFFNPDIYSLFRHLRIVNVSSLSGSIAMMEPEKGLLGSKKKGIS